MSEYGQTLPRERPVAGPTEVVASEPLRLGLGWAPALFTSCALGLLIIAVGDALSRSTVSSNQAPFWVGLLLIFTPITYRLMSPAPGRTERLFLVVLLGLSFYLVKVFFAPFGFTFSDELAHQPNVNAILHTHHLFTKNSLISVTPSYPGLESVTAGLAAMTGLTAFGAGLIVVGVARVVMMLGLYLLFERVSGSPRAAGLGTAVYTANANFVFFDSQFSYESLALPLLLAVLAGVAERRTTRYRWSWTIALVLLISGIIVTHHVSSYVLVILLTALCWAYALLAVRRIREAPADLALFAFVACVAWLAVVASNTVGYLKPVLFDAFRQTIRTFQGEAAPRQLFAASGYQPPVAERVIGILSVIILLALFPIGLRALFQRHRREPYAILLALVGCAYFATLVMRYVPAAWETANRASEFVFIGVAFVVGMIVTRTSRPRWGPVTLLAALAAALSIVFVGGVISGWDVSLRLAPPYRVEAGGATIDSEGRALARFAATHFPGARFGASDSDARFLASYARAWALTGRSPDLYDVLRSPKLETWERLLLRQQRLRYVAVDLRERSFDNTAGYYFGLRRPFGRPDALLPRYLMQKFARAGFPKIYDSGNIAIFERPG